MDDYKTLIIYLGSTGNATYGYQVYFLRRWLEGAWQNTADGKYYIPCYGGYAMLTFNSATQITVTSTSAFVRAVRGLKV